jgi:hypothetical protein
VHERVLRLDLDLRAGLRRRFTPDALVVQEDRYLVLSAPAVLDLHRPLRQGRYLVLRPREGAPFWTYQAVVHDVELRPTCRPGDVRRCLRAISRDAVQRDLDTIATEQLGCWDDAGLKVDEMIDALDEAVLEMALELTRPLRLILLLEDVNEVEEVSMGLRSRVLRRATRRFRTVGGDAAVVEVQQEPMRLHYRFVPGSLSGYQVTRPDAA